MGAFTHWANPKFGGVDPETGKRWIVYDLILGGFGGPSMKDGAEALCPVFICANMPVEVHETNNPVRHCQLNWQQADLLIPPAPRYTSSHGNNPGAKGGGVFTQVLNPFGGVFAVWLVALIPVALLLFMLAVLRMTAWLATLIGSIVTLFLGVVVWGMPLHLGIGAYVFGSLTGIWAVNWITFWGVVLFNTLVTTGTFESFRAWLTTQGTADVAFVPRRPGAPSSGPRRRCVRPRPG